MDAPSRKAPHIPREPSLDTSLSSLDSSMSHQSTIYSEDARSEMQASISQREAELQALKSLLRDRNEKKDKEKIYQSNGKRTGKLGVKWMQTSADGIVDPAQEEVNMAEVKKIFLEQESEMDSLLRQLEHFKMQNAHIEEQRSGLEERVQHYRKRERKLLHDLQETENQLEDALRESVDSKRELDSVSHRMGDISKEYERELRLLKSDLVRLQSGSKLAERERRGGIHSSSPPRPSVEHSQSFAPSATQAASRDSASSFLHSTSAVSELAQLNDTISKWEAKYLQADALLREEKRKSASLSIQLEEYRSAAAMDIQTSERMNQSNVRKLGDLEKVLQKEREKLQVVTSDCQIAQVQRDGAERKLQSLTHDFGLVSRELQSLREGRSTEQLHSAATLSELKSLRLLHNQLTEECEELRKNYRKEQAKSAELSKDRIQGQERLADQARELELMSQKLAHQSMVERSSSPSIPPPLSPEGENPIMAAQVQQLQEELLASQDLLQLEAKEVSKLREMLRTARKEEETLREKVVTLEQDLSIAQQQVEQAKEQAKEQAASFARPSEHRAVTPPKPVPPVPSAVTSSISDNRLSALEEDCRLLADALAKARTERDAFRWERDDVQEKWQAHMRQCTHGKHDIGAMMSRLEELLENAANLEKANQNLQQQIVKLQDEKNTLQENIKTLEESYSAQRYEEIQRKVQQYEEALRTYESFVDQNPTFIQQKQKGNQYDPVVQDLVVRVHEDNVAVDEGSLQSPTKASLHLAWAEEKERVANKEHRIQELLEDLKQSLLVQEQQQALLNKMRAERNTSRSDRSNSPQKSLSGSQS